MGINAGIDRYFNVAVNLPLAIRLEYFRGFIGYKQIEPSKSQDCCKRSDKKAVFTHNASLSNAPMMRWVCKKQILLMDLCLGGNFGIGLRLPYPSNGGAWGWPRSWG